MLDGRFARLLARLRHSYQPMQEKKRFLASTFSGYRAAMLRRLALSYWTPVTLGTVLLGIHLAWAIRWEPTKRGEVVTGFGAGLIVLGLFVAARPYIRLGLQPFIRNALTPDVSAFVTDEAYDEQLRAIHAAELPQVTRDAWAERVVAVAVIAIGTVLNGYGAPLVRWLGLEG